MRSFDFEDDFAKRVITRPILGFSECSQFLLFFCFLFRSGSLGFEKKAITRPIISSQNLHLTGLKIHLFPVSPSVSLNSTCFLKNVFFHFVGGVGGGGSVWGVLGW